ncbi:MAG TPA: hypothetical protein VIT88_07640 [Pyrinomonadaceae bacterium]
MRQRSDSSITVIGCFRCTSPLTSFAVTGRGDFTIRDADGYQVILAKPISR